MLSTEGTNVLVEDPTSNNILIYDDNDLDEQFDQRTNSDDKSIITSIRPETTKTLDSQTNEDNKNVGLIDSRPILFGFSANNFKRDPTIDLIIESRKSTLIENAYTRLAQTTSNSIRSIPNIRINSIKTTTMTVATDNDVQTTNDKNKKGNAQNGKNRLIQSNIQFDNGLWDDELNSDYDKESIASKDKSSVQVYEESCKRLNICPCSTIIRSLYTSEINLNNYGLGPKGAAALAVALVRNTSVTSLRLSGNDIRNAGMSHIYQILTENAYIDEYDLSFNNLGSKGIHKLATAVTSCPHLKLLNIAGNHLAADDINFLLNKIEDHPNLKDLNISHNNLGEEGGVHLAKWLGDNSVLLNLNVSWCSIRLNGARALAKSIGDNNKLLSLDISHNSFSNATIDVFNESLKRNQVLNELDLSGNEIVYRDDEEPVTSSSLYKMLLVAITNQSLKILRLRKIYIDNRRIIPLLKALSQLDNISLEELDLTGITLDQGDIVNVENLFSKHANFTCYTGIIRHTVEHHANNLLNSIDLYCKQNEINLPNMFLSLNESQNASNSIMTYDQFLDGIKKAKISYPMKEIRNIMKYLGREDDENTISFRALEII